MVITGGCTASRTLTGSCADSFWGTRNSAISNMRGRPAEFPSRWSPISPISGSRYGKSQAQIIMTANKQAVCAALAAKSLRNRAARFSGEGHARPGGSRDRQGFRSWPTGHRSRGVDEKAEPVRRSSDRVALRQVYRARQTGRAGSCRRSSWPPAQRHRHCFGGRRSLGTTFPADGMRRATLRGVDLRGAKLVGTDLTGADLTEALYRPDQLATAVTEGARG